MNEYISTIEAAKILGVSRVTIFHKIKSGDISAAKVGRNYIVPRSEIESLAKGDYLTNTQKAEIDEGVERVFFEYGETLKLLQDS